MTKALRKPEPAKAPPIAYSVVGAADAIGISKTTIWRLIAAHELPTFKLGARTLIRADQLAAFVDRQSKTA